MAAFCFPTCRGAHAWTLDAPAAAGVLRNDAELKALLASSRLDDRLVAVAWTAEWIALDSDTRAAVRELQLECGDISQVVTADVDAVPAAARSWAVHDLPSLHIFHRGSLVERLSGLHAVRHCAGPLLQHHADLAAASEGEASLQATPSAWPDAAACRSPAAVSGASSADGSCISELAPTAAGPAFERRHSGASTASFASERSYMPQYVRTLRRQPEAATGAAGALQRLPCDARSVSLGSAAAFPGGRSHLLLT